MQKPNETNSENASTVCMHYTKVEWNGMERRGMEGNGVRTHALKVSECSELGKTAINKLSNWGN